MWVTTNKNGEKCLWETKPTRQGDQWVANTRIILGEYPFNDLPSFVQQQQWKDAPIQVKLSMVKK